MLIGKKTIFSKHNEYKTRLTLKIQKSFWLKYAFYFCMILKNFCFYFRFFLYFLFKDQFAQLTNKLEGHSIHVP